MNGSFTMFNSSKNKFHIELFNSSSYEFKGNYKVSKYNVLVKKVDASITFSKDKLSKKASYLLVS